MIVIVLKIERKKCELFPMPIEEKPVNCVRHSRGFTQTYFSFNLFIKSIDIYFFLRIDFNSMKIIFSFFRIFQCCSQLLVTMFDLSIEIKSIFEKSLKLLYLENFVRLLG